MKLTKIIAAASALALLLSACTAERDLGSSTEYTDAVAINLAADGITVGGAPVSTDAADAVYTANDIVYYEAGRGIAYGEGGAADEHSPEEAAAHTVLHITQAGRYLLSGTLEKGQIAVDLGEDAESDPNAVVTLILNGADITCEVAPAIIFYNVYECGSSDAESASKDVDTSAAGANVIIADGTENTVNGSYVARIYKPDSVVLSEDGSTVEDAKKLHKYDAAFYSKMSMNVTGDGQGRGVLNINAANEGLDSELHLTLNGGIINISSGNDGINTNEDGVSVTTVNGGELHIRVSGETGEGDGIDSNGWLVINGGLVTAEACSESADAGIDSDMGIHINGGTVIASGHMLDRIEDGGQTYAVLSFAGGQSGETVTLKDEKGGILMETAPENNYSILIYSSPSLAEGTYTLWSGGTQLAGSGGGMGQMLPGGMGGGFGGERPEGMTPPDGGEGGMQFERPEGDFPGEPPEGMEIPEGMERPERPEDFENMTPPEGGFGGMRPGGMGGFGGEVSTDFRITSGGNMFSGVTKAE